jgi:hypothetical protein
MKKLLTMTALIALTSACTPKATVIGTPGCKVNGDCNVKGQVCVNSICTHACSSQVGTLGCPVGFDCTVADAKVGPTCNKISYTVDASGKPVLFKLDCGLDDNKCLNTGDPNPMPMCRHKQDMSQMTPTPLEADPRAYCTGSCSADTDCPIDMQCLKDYDGVTKCLKRTLCSECVINEDCGTEFPVCVPDQGTGHYCTKPCASWDDCGGAQGLFLSCVGGYDAAGNGGMFCFHRAGACVGAGNLCDPCRTSADCALTSSSCITNDATHESFCTHKCKLDTDCGGPNGSTCDNVMPRTSADNSPNLICTGDKAHTQTGVVSCWF